MVALKSTLVLAWASYALAGHAWNSTSSVAPVGTGGHTKTHSPPAPSSGYSQSYPSQSYIWGNSTNYNTHTKTQTQTTSPGSVYTTSSTTYFTTTLPGGSVSTGTSVVPYTTTAASTTAPLLSNNAMGREAQGVLGLIAAGLLAVL